MSGVVLFSWTGCVAKVSFQENVEWWKQSRERAKLGAAAAANAAARYLMKRAQTDTLQRTTHPPGAWHWTRPGDPPARGSGSLIRSMYHKPAFGRLRATAVWGNSSDYGRIQEFGCSVEPLGDNEFMHWRDSGGSWFHEFLVVKEHPFMSPTLEEAISDGELQDVIIAAFREYDP